MSKVPRREMHMFRAGRKNLLQGRLRQVIAIKAANPRRAWVTTIEGLSHVVGAKAEEDKKKDPNFMTKVEPSLRNHFIPYHGKNV